MFLINRLGFYASHPAAFCNLAGPICLFPVGCFCIHSPSPPSGPASPGCCGDTRKKEITAEEETTHQQRSQYSLIRIMAVGCAKIGAVPTTLR